MLPLQKTFLQLAATYTAAFPLARVLFSGQLIDEEQDMNYGPAHYLTPEQVREVNTALAAITTANFRQRYHAEKLQEKGVYPEGWADDESEKDYLAASFEELKRFYAIAAQQEEAIITYIS